MRWAAGGSVRQCTVQEVVLVCVPCAVQRRVYSVAIVWLGSLLVRDVYLINVN